MIIFSLKGDQIYIKFRISQGLIFSQAVATAKRLHCRWKDTEKSWVIPASRYFAAYEAFSEVDVLEQEFTESDLENATVRAPELEVEKTRRIPDYSLLNYEPIVGKHPYENYQREAITKGINRSRYAYFFDMGTGKSYIAAAIIAHRLYKYKDVKKIFFLTSSIGVRNLKDELVKFIKDIDESRISIADVNNRLPFRSNVDIVISNYNTLRLMAEAYPVVPNKIQGLLVKLRNSSREATQEKLKQELADMLDAIGITISTDLDANRFADETKRLLNKHKHRLKGFKLRAVIEEWMKGGEGMLLLDESHQLSNPQSQRSRVAVSICEAFKYRYLFTGTPADVPVKLYNQFRILDPWLVYDMSFSEWKERMAYLGTPFSATAIREWKKDELEKSNSRFVQLHGNYLNVSDVLDLPEFFEKRIPVDMSSKQRYIYEEAVSSILSSAKDEKSMVNVFPYQLLAVDNPILLRKHSFKFPESLNQAISKFKMDDLEKIKVLDDIVADNPDEKILVWAIHPATIKSICERYKNLNPLYVIGDTDQNERNKIVNTFKHDRKCKMLIANITTLSTSVTLSPECHIQVYMERGFQYDQYSQSQRRIFRIGSNQPAITYIPLYKNSLDYFVDKNLSSKGMLVKGLVSKGFISQEDWKKIYNMNESTVLDFEGEI